MTFRFEPIGHHYYLGEQLLWSVTQALKDAGVIDYSMIPQHILQAAAARGTFVHQAIHAWFDGELDESKIPRLWTGYIDAAKRYCDDVRMEPQRVECRHYHREHLYAGTFDVEGLCFAAGDPTITDWKTGIILPGHAQQLCAYAALRLHPRKYRRIAVQLRQDGTYRAHEYPSREHPDNTFTRDWAVFARCLEFVRMNGAVTA